MAEFDDAAIEKVARDLCLRVGKDPDEMVRAPRIYVVSTPIGDQHRVWQNERVYPLWHCWWGMAVEVLRVARDLVPVTKQSP